MLFATQRFDGNFIYSWAFGNDVIFTNSHTARGVKMIGENLSGKLKELILMAFRRYCDARGITSTIGGVKRLITETKEFKDLTNTEARNETTNS